MYWFVLGIVQYSKRTVGALRRITLLVMLITIFVSLLALQATANGDDLSIVLDGVPIVLIPSPVEQNGEILVPMQIMSEAMGFKTSWDTRRQAMCGVRQHHIFIARLNSQQAFINGQPFTLPCKVQIISHQCYIPLSFLCLVLGAEFNRTGDTLMIYDHSSPDSPTVFSLAGLPELKFVSQPRSGQGEYLCLYLNNIDPCDHVTLQTDLNTRADFYPIGKGRLLLLPISCIQKPGLYSLKIRAQRNSHTYLWAQENIQILSRSFPTQHLKVSSKIQSKHSAAMWALDKPFWERGLSHSADRPLWKGTFINPASGRISTRFGSVRTVNKEKPTRHSGLDIALPTGTPVKASQAGVVTLAMPLHVTGNTVFVDHGCQLFSMYYHLSSISVKKGQNVNAGDLIGKVGSTGFSTGSHLHWSMQLNDIYVNPALFLDSQTAPMTVTDNIMSK